MLPLGSQILQGGFSKDNFCFNWAPKFRREALVRPIFALTGLQFFRAGFSKANFCFNWAPKSCREVFAKLIFALTGLQNFAGKL